MGGSRSSGSSGAGSASSASGDPRDIRTVLRDLEDRNRFPGFQRVNDLALIDPNDSSRSTVELEDLDRLPASIRQRLVDDGVRVLFRDQPITEFPEMEFLKNEQFEVGGGSDYAFDTRTSYSQISAAYNPGTKVAYIGRTPGRTAAVASIVLHEVGHAIGDRLGFDTSPQLRQHHRNLYDRLSPYLKQGRPGHPVGMQELLAEGVAEVLYNGRQSAGRRFSSDFADWVQNTVLGD